MGEDVLILAFVVIVIGGIGSVRGAFIAAIFTGVIDTMGRAFLDVFLLIFMPVNAAEAAGPALSSMLIYILMAAILFSGHRACFHRGAAGEPHALPFEPAALLASAVVVLCAIVPVVAPLLGESFYVIVFARIMIWAIAATSLNLIMGYGGLVSFGHAVYLGIGGYTIGILAEHDIGSGWIQWPIAIGLSALVALVFRGHQPADARSVFHHDHAGTGADGLFPERECRTLWQR